jgi:hypothetical protein
MEDIRGSMLVIPLVLSADSVSSELHGLCLFKETASVSDMTESLQSDTASPRRRTERITLDVALYDTLAAAKGFGNIEEQALRHKVRRPHWSAVRNGRKEPSAALALRVADDLGVQPKVIWNRGQVGE